MVLYEYECKPNGHRFEVRHCMNESPVQRCVECKGDVRRVITAAGLVFKGSGFYVTDSRKEPDSMSGTKPSSDGRKSQGQAESAKIRPQGTSGVAKATH